MTAAVTGAVPPLQRSPLIHNGAARRGAHGGVSHGEPPPQAGPRPRRAPCPIRGWGQQGQERRRGWEVNGEAGEM